MQRKNCAPTISPGKHTTAQLRTAACTSCTSFYSATLTCTVLRSCSNFTSGRRSCISFVSFSIQMSGPSSFSSVKSMPCLVRSTNTTVKSMPCLVRSANTTVFLWSRVDYGTVSILSSNFGMELKQLRSQIHIIV